MKWLPMTAVAAMLAVGVAASTVRADDLKELKQTARAVAKKTSKAVITARLVLKISIGEREQEQKVEITGTVIDPSGLTVVSASALDPAATLRGLMGGGRRGGGGGGGGEQMRVETEVSETSLVLEDGTELEATVVLKDAELDLAFIKPNDEKVKLDYVDLKVYDSKDHYPQALDDIFVVGRLGRAANRAISIATGELRAVVTGPHTFYVADNEISAGHTGCVAYEANGETLGIFTTRTVRTEGGAGGGMGGFRGGRGGGDVMVVIRPVSDVLELAKQAKEKKVEKKDEKKSDEKKPEKKSDEKKKDDF